jgi:hypothetical protein
MTLIFVSIILDDAHARLFCYRSLREAQFGSAAAEFFSRVHAHIQLRLGINCLV